MELLQWLDSKSTNFTRKTASNLKAIEEVNVTGICREAKDALTTHVWKGNIRELRNLIERAVLLGQGPETTPQDLRLEKPGQNATDSQDTANPDEEAGIAFPALTPHGFNLPALHESLDRHYFQKSLEMTEGNAAKAARLLNMSYYAFRFFFTRSSSPD